MVKGWYQMYTNKASKGKKMKPVAKKTQVKIVNKPAHVREEQKESTTSNSDSTPQFCGHHADV